MKKIFTFLICFGLFTSAFAQQRDRRNNDGSQPSQYSRNDQYQRQDQNNHDWQGNNDAQWGKDSREKEYAYNNKEHSSDRDANRRSRYGRYRNDRNDSRYDNQRVYPDYPQMKNRKPSILQIILGINF